MTTEVAVELTMHIDRVGPAYDIRVVNGSGFDGPLGLCFAVEVEGSARHLITSEQDWRDVVSRVHTKG